MADVPLARATRELCHVVRRGGDLELSDGQLLTQFATRHDEAAFAELVCRHGPMVVGVCRRVLGNAHDAEDACQVAFLILARKAAGAVRQQTIAGWLHAVAYHVALRERARRRRRQRQERQAEMVPPEPTMTDLDRHDLRQVLDEELRRLPQKYRTPLVLCYLEGRSNEEVARTLACPVSTLAWRLGRGRVLLRGRLLRRGLALSTTSVGTTLTEQTVVALPAEWIRAIARGAVAFAKGSAAADGISPGAAALAEEASMSLSLTKLKLAAALALLVALGFAAGLRTSHPLAAEPPSEGKPAKPDAAAPKPDAPAAPFQERKTFKPAVAPARLDRVQFLAFAPDGQRLVEGDSREARLYDATTGQRLAALKGPVPKLNPINPETGAVGKERTVSAYLMFDATGQELAAIDETGVTLWDLETKKVVAELDIGGWRGGNTIERFTVSAVTCSVDGMRAAAGDRNGTVKVWDLTGVWTKKPLANAQLLTLAGADARTQALAFSSDGQRVAASYGNGEVRVWETATGTELMTTQASEPEDLFWGHTHVRALMFAADGTRLAVAHRTGLKLFDVAASKKQAAFVFGDGLAPARVGPAARPPESVSGDRPLDVTSVAFSLDGKAVVAGLSDGQVYVWDLTTTWTEATPPRQPFAKLKHSPSGDGRAQVEAIAFSPDGKSFATGSRDGVIKVWEAVRDR